MCVLWCTQQKLTVSFTTRSTVGRPIAAHASTHPGNEGSFGFWDALVTRDASGGERLLARSLTVCRYHQSQRRETQALLSGAALACVSVCVWL